MGEPGTRPLPLSPSIPADDEAYALHHGDASSTSPSALLRPKFRDHSIKTRKGRSSYIILYMNKSNRCHILCTGSVLKLTKRLYRNRATQNVLQHRDQRNFPSLESLCTSESIRPRIVKEPPIIAQSDVINSYQRRPFEDTITAIGERS